MQRNPEYLEPIQALGKLIAQRRTNETADTPLDLTNPEVRHAITNSILYLGTCRDTQALRVCLEGGKGNYGLVRNQFGSEKDD